MEDPDSQSPRLALERGGVHSAGSLLLARFLMFQQVYFHPVRRIYDHHLLQVLSELLPEGHFPDDVEAYLGWDDPRIESLISQKGTEEPTIEAARRFADRDHFRTAFQAPEGQVEVYQAREAELHEALEREIGAEHFHLDSASKELATASELELPIVQSGALVSRWEDESRLFATLPALGFFRVHVRNDQRLIRKAHEVVNEVFET